MSFSKPVKCLLILILLAVLLKKTRQHCETKSNRTYLVRKDNAPVYCNCREENLIGCAVLNEEYPDYYSCTGLGVYESIQCCQFKHLVKCCNGWARLQDSCSLAICSPPCLNGGFCIAPQTCSCRRGFHGSVCQTPICHPLCENGGSCVAPDTCICKHGYTGPICSNGICDPTCYHGGVCVAPQLCKCRPGYYGQLCEKGDELTNLFTPTLHLANAPSSTNSWYKTASTYSKACFMKIFLHVNDSSEILTFTSQSLDDQGRLLGNYTAIALDEKNSLSGPLRSVCLDVKCPDEQRGHLDTIKVLTQANTNLRCNVTSVVTGMSKNIGENLIETVLRSGYDYGPFYGIYTAYGSPSSSKTIAEKMCYSGRNTIYSSQKILPSLNPNSVFYC